MGWRHFIMSLGSLEPKAVERILVDHGAIAITYNDGRDDPILEPSPGKTPLWQHTELKALFDQETDLSTLTQTLIKSLQLATAPQHRFEDFQDANWESKWLKDFKPMQFGKRLWVIPTDMTSPDKQAIIVRIAPGLAFGTGTHPTTALCLEWLESIRLENKRLYDYGCGSGILGIAALKLGAKEVVAIDTDQQALTSTKLNAEKNGVTNRVCIRTDVNIETVPCDIIIANILARTLIDNASLICRKLKSAGQIGLSGILPNQVDDVINTYREYVNFDEPHMRDKWVLLTGLRK